jgi:hypothetical protein
MARGQGIVLTAGLDQVSQALRQTNLLIGTALRVLTDDVDNQATLKTSARRPPPAATRSFDEP